MAVGSFKLPISAPSGDWIRPSDWLPMPQGITSADQTFVGLHAIFPEGQNYCAFRFTTSTGQYQVDWGDGTIDLVNSNVNAEHDYNYATYDTGNATLSSRGYKQAIITVTAVSGNLASCNFQQRYVTSPIQNQAYTTGFLDCILSMPNASNSPSIFFGGSTVGHRFVERVNILTIGGCTSMASMFFNCILLQSVPLFNTVNITSMTTMFQSCLSIKTLPLFNTSSVTSMQGMFQSCSSLKSLPLFDTTNVTSVSSMLRFCNTLIEIPNFNLASCTLFSFFADGCSSITKFPSLNTSLSTSFTNFLLSCVSLKEIPALSTASATFTTDFGANFANGCSSLTRCQMVIRNTVSFNACQLSQTALVEIFTNLADRTSTTSATITITGNWGASALTAGERLIATNKNWVIVG